MSTIKKNIDKIYENIIKNDRELSDITLVAVTKNVDEKFIKEAIDLGVKNLGENRVQEFISKYNNIKDKSINWHFIGNLQTNKVKYIIDKVCLIHSVNSMRLANEINKQANKIGKIQDILLEINVSQEKNKIGLPKEDVDNMIKEISKLPNIRLKGLMGIAPYVENTQDIAVFFKTLNEIFIDINRKSTDNINMSYLSMGMTNDYNIALQEGSNIIRIGTGIFGDRS